MSRYIDADVLIADLDKGLWGKDWDKALAEAIINNAPTIDAVSVVRCKECKHSTYCYGDVIWTNKRQTVDIHKDIDFCSYGEREGE